MLVQTKVPTQEKVGGGVSGRPSPDDVTRVNEAHGLCPFTGQPSAERGAAKRKAPFGTGESPLRNPAPTPVLTLHKITASVDLNVPVFPCYEFLTTL